MPQLMKSLSFLLVNTNEMSIARGHNSLARSLDSCKQGTSYMVIIMYPIIGFRQKWRPSRLGILKTMCFSFYDQKTPSWNSELKEINLEGILDPGKSRH